MEQWLARRAHNPKVGGSSPSPAIFSGGIAQLVEQRNHNPLVVGSSPSAAKTLISGGVFLTTANLRVKANVNAYLFLEKGDQILLMLRENTGYFDGYWSVPSGHVDAGESAIQGMVREAYEEIGITINPEDLHPKHIIHRQTERVNVDIFFTCSKWRGEPINNEPHKCGGIRFSPKEALPEKLIDYVSAALTADTFYSESGF